MEQMAKTVTKVLFVDGRVMRHSGQTRAGENLGGASLPAIIATNLSSEKN